MSSFENPTPRLSSSSTSVCIEISYDDHDEDQSYRELVTKIAANLNVTDVRKLAFTHRSNVDEQKMKDNNIIDVALKLLQQLEETGKIGPTKVEKLQHILASLPREDLNNQLVEPFITKQRTERDRRFHSFSGISSPRQITSPKRSKTFSGSSKKTINLPVIQQETQCAAGTIVTTETGEPESHASTYTATTRPQSAQIMATKGTAEASSTISETNLPHLEQLKSTTGSSNLQTKGATHLHIQQPSSRTSLSDMSSIAVDESGFLTENDKLSDQDDISNRPNFSSALLSHQIGDNDHIPADQGTQRLVPTRSTEFILINNQLFEVSSFHLPMQKSVTPPSSALLQRARSFSASTAQENMHSSFADTTSFSEASPSMKSHASRLTHPDSNALSYAMPQRNALTCTLSLSDHSQSYGQDKTLLGQQTSTSSKSDTGLTVQPIQTRKRLQEPTSAGFLQRNEATTHASTPPEKEQEPEVLISPTSANLSKIKKYPLGSKSKLVKEVEWTLKRHKLNEFIYEHKENELFECKKKLEVPCNSDSSLNPKLTLVLHPCGLDEDKGKYASIVVYVSVPIKAPLLEESAKAKLELTVMEGEGDKKILNKDQCDIQLLYRFKKWFKVVSHDSLKNSFSKTIQIAVTVINT